MPRIHHKDIWKFDGVGTAQQSDAIAGEEPLEINVRFGPADRRSMQSVAITMRTEGDDEDLVRGFLFTENIIARESDVVLIKRLDEANRIVVELSGKTKFDIEGLTRHVFTSSSCGICGKASLEQVTMAIPYVLRPGIPSISLSEIVGWPEIARRKQESFASTGGLHATALFDASGELLLLREDVGRHNAMDKLIGCAFEKDWLPLDNYVCLVSGRASFELVQKALMAGIPIVLAVGAPSSLAIDLAEAHNLTLIGFLRNGQCNIYSGRDRILDL